MITGNCNVSGSVGDGGVTLEGTGGSPSAPGSGGDGSVGSGVTTGETVDEPCTPIEALGGRCYAEGPGRAQPTDGAPAVTLADVAQFRPQSAQQGMEPDGWMVVGLDTNFFAITAVHQVEGALLGQPASVRFTPVAWTWTYGDGTSRTSGVPGAPWSVSGAREFDATPTSHVYDRPGTYTIDLTVDYAAEYRLAGGPWVSLAGTVRVAANQLVAVAGDAKTVLVERGCSVASRGPGC